MPAIARMARSCRATVRPTYRSELAREPLGTVPCRFASKLAPTKSAPTKKAPCGAFFMSANGQ